MAPPVRALLALLCVGLLIGSCVGSDGPTGVDGGPALAALTLQPALIPSPADVGALPVNRIRALVTRQPDGAVVRDARFEVLPADTAWTININVPLTGSTTEVVVSLYLLNVGSGGSEEVPVAVNWRVDRIRDNELVLVRTNPNEPGVGAMTRIIPLHDT